MRKAGGFRKFWNNPWVITVAGGLLVAMIGYYGFGIGQSPSPFSQQTHSGIGDNVTGDKIVNLQRKIFSETQFIRLLPPSLGGKDTLNLDNLATLTSHVPYDERGITLLLNVVPVEEPPSQNKNLHVEGLKSYHHTKEQEYVFDTENNKGHTISAEGRVFKVTLITIRRLNVQNVSSPIEYEFGISETN